MVLTHLDAWGMPLIRYRTGDVAVNFVDEIPRDASGKYRYVVSHVGAFGGK